jgi:proline dehydrogenase
MSERTEELVRKFKKAVFKLLDNYTITRAPTNWLIRVLGEPYLAGHSLDEAVTSVNFASFMHKRFSTLDVLGEAAKVYDDATRYQRAYTNLLHTLATQIQGPNGATISVKPSAICLCTETETAVTFDARTPLEGTLEAIVSGAKSKGIGVTLDMEDFRYTDASLQVAQTLWNKGYDNLGIVLQSRLNRTSKDIERLFGPETTYPIAKKKMRVRACIGIYDESETIATKSKAEAKTRLVENIKQLFQRGVYVEIATHDHAVIHEVVQYIKDQHIPTSRFEFQFLKGVQKAYDIEPELRELGYKVRYYMPFEIKEGDGIPYTKRRLIANPDMILSGAKNLWHKCMSY